MMGLSFKAILGIVGSVGVVGGFILLKRSIENWIQRKHERDQYEDNLEKQRGEAQKWANSHTVPTPDRLRKLAEAKRRGKA